MIRHKEGKETAKKYVGEEHSRQRETALNTGPEAMRMSAQPGGQCDGAELGGGGDTEGREAKEGLELAESFGTLLQLRIYYTRNGESLYGLKLRSNTI